MSGLRHLLDTNVVIGYLDGGEASKRLVEDNGADTLSTGISQITKIELLSFPTMTADLEARLVALVAAVTVIPLDERIEAETITLRRRTRMKLPDAIIAATAKVQGLSLLTLDERLSAALRT